MYNLRTNDGDWKEHSSNMTVFCILCRLRRLSSSSSLCCMGVCLLSQESGLRVQQVQHFRQLLRGTRDRDTGCVQDRVSYSR